MAIRGAGECVEILLNGQFKTVQSVPRPRLAAKETSALRDTVIEVSASPRSTARFRAMTDQDRIKLKDELQKRRKKGGAR